MARHRLSTGILSPIHSDLSLNDISAFSFGSSPDTPDFNKDDKNINKYIEKDSDSSSFCKRTIKESANTLQAMSSDIKKQSNINAEREEKFKESYKMLRQSMDELFYNKSSFSSIPSPVSKDGEDFICDRKSDSNVNTKKTDKKSQNLKVYEKVLTSAAETSHISNKKIERIKKESMSSVNKEQKNNHHKNNCRQKLSADNTDAKLCHGYKPKTSKTASASKQIDKSLETKQITSKKLYTKSEVKAKDFQFKTQQKIAVSNNIPITENKSLSIEKTIEIAVGMEMDNIRSLILDQNANLQKELFKLQDMAQKQAEVTRYLFSVVDELLETNKKLIAKHK